MNKVTELPSAHWSSIFNRSSCDSESPRLLRQITAWHQTVRNHVRKMKLLARLPSLGSVPSHLLLSQAAPAFTPRLSPSFPLPHATVAATSFQILVTRSYCFSCPSSLIRWSWSLILKHLLTVILSPTPVRIKKYPFLRNNTPRCLFKLFSHIICVHFCVFTMFVSKSLFLNNLSKPFNPQDVAGDP